MCVYRNLFTPEMKPSYLRPHCFTLSIWSTILFFMSKIHISRIVENHHNFRFRPCALTSLAYWLGELCQNLQREGSDTRRHVMNFYFTGMAFAGSQILLMRSGKTGEGVKSGKKKWVYVFQAVVWLVKSNAFKIHECICFSQNLFPYYLSLSALPSMLIFIQLT